MSSSRPGPSTAGHCPRKMTVATYQEMILLLVRYYSAMNAFLYSCAWKSEANYIMEALSNSVA